MGSSIRRGDGKGRRRWLAAGIAVAIIVIVAGLMAAATLHNRWARPERESRQLGSPIQASERGAEGQAPTDGPGASRLVLEVAVAQLVLLPAPAETTIRIDALFDPVDYELRTESEGSDEAGWIHRVTFRPRGSESWALLRVKIGGTIPVVRVAVPRGVELDLEGSLRGGLAALELGGLRLRSADLEVDGGAVTVSIAEPLPAPMESFHVHGSMGSLEVTRLGNASPRETVLEHRLGVLDLDLRGAWSGESSVRIDAPIAAGTMWLPDDVTILGFEVEGWPRAPQVISESEALRPTLLLDVTASSRTLVVIE